MLADKTGVIPHSNVVMATLEPHEYKDGSTVVFSLKPWNKCTVNLEGHIPGVHHALDEGFLPIYSKLVVWFAHDYCAGAFKFIHWPCVQGLLHLVYQAIRSCGQCMESSARMIY